MIISGPSQTSSTQWPKIKQHKNKINRNPNPESRRRKENESLLVSPAPPSSHQKPSPLLACFAAGLPLQLNKTEYNNHRNGSWEHPMRCLLSVVMVRRWRVICRVTSASGLRSLELLAVELHCVGEHVDGTWNPAAQRWGWIVMGQVA